MTLPHAPRVLVTLIETLVDETDPLLRDRILFEAAKASGAARAVGLWREADPDGSARERRWIPLYASASAEELPNGPQIEGASSGARSWKLPQDRMVWVAGPRGRRVALALAGAREGEELDRLEALFHVYARIEAADSTAGGTAQDWLPGLGPETSPPGAKTSGGPGTFEHDLRNLLGSIRMNQDLIEEFGDGLDEAERRAYAEALDREIERAGDLILSSLCDGSGPFGAGAPRAPVRVVAGSVVQAELPGWSAGGLSLELVVAPDAEDLASNLDGQALAQVLSNLLRNAREALASSVAPTRAGAGAVLRIAAHTPARDRVRVELEDDGPGLPPVPVDRLFARGFSLSHEPGRGLGLAVVREHVERAGGRCWAKDRPAGGAVFGFTLPSSAATSPSGASCPPSGASCPPSSASCPPSGAS